MTAILVFPFKNHGGVSLDFRVFFELFKADYNMIHEFVLEKVKFVVVALRFIRPSPFHPPK